MITEKQLLAFCAKDDIRHYLMTPYVQDGFVVASNGHICIRTTGEFASAQTHNDVKPPSITGLTEKTKLITQLFEAIAIPDLPPIKKCQSCGGSGKEFVCPKCDGDGCEECGGSGSTEIDSGKTRDCWFCDGIGEEQAQEVECGDGWFARRYLAMIKDLPGAMIKTNGPSGAAYFTFDGGDGALMPLWHRE